MMDTYSLLRHIADSWVLILLVAFFLGTVAWAFRPGSGKIHREIGAIPLRDDDELPQDIRNERAGNV